MKRMLSTTEYYFNAGGSQIDFSSYADFDPKRLLAVINITAGQKLIYATGSGSGPISGTFSGIAGSYQLYLNFNTSSMSDTDTLQVIYDQEESTSADIVSGVISPNVNLISSSFGGTLNDPIGAPFQDNLLSTGFLSGSVLESPALNMNSELIVDCTQSGSIPVSGAVSVTGSTVSVDNFPVSQAVTGTFYPATQPVSATSLPLPSGAATSSLQTSGNTSLSSIDGKLTTLNTNSATSALQTSGNAITTSIDATLVGITNKTPTLGQKLSSGSSPVVLPSDQVVNTTLPDLFITGQSLQTATINNIIPTNSSATATDASSYRSGSCQVISTATGGVYVFECSNDNVSWQAMPVYNQASINGSVTVAGIAATASQLIYVFSIQFRYIRLRISTTLTGGSVQAFTRLSQAAFSPSSMQVAQNVATNLNATVAGALTSVGTVTTVTGVTTVNSVSSCNLAAAQTTDIASAAITTTATSANINISGTQSSAIGVYVTAISGAGAFMDVEVQESLNGGDYFTVYTFERITAIGQYYSPLMKSVSANLRYIRTIGGTTPSVTNSINRTQRSGNSEIIRRFINRTIDLNTLNSVTGTYLCEGVENFNLIIRCTAQTTAATLALQFSTDGTNWFTTATTVTTAVGIVRVAYTNEQWKFVRVIVTAAGSGITLDNVYIAGHSA